MNKKETYANNAQKATCSISLKDLESPKMKYQYVTDGTLFSANTSVKETTRAAPSQKAAQNQAPLKQ